MMVFYNNKFNNPTPTPGQELAFGNSITMADGDLRNTIKVHTGRSTKGWAQYATHSLRSAKGWEQHGSSQDTRKKCTGTARAHGGPGEKYDMRRYNGNTERSPDDMDLSDSCSGIEYLKAKRQQFENIG